MGVVVGWVNDVTLMLGCALEISDMLTAIVLVAAGTSIPDTFASKIAAERDDTADESITNVTGSNSVNVFLGLGLPWTMAAVYWNNMADSTAVMEWVATCCGHDLTLITKYGPEWITSSVGLEGKKGGIQGLIMDGSSIGLPTLAFLSCATGATVLLNWRRKNCGGELGGDSRMFSAGLLVLFWACVIVVTAAASSK